MINEQLITRIRCPLTGESLLPANSELLKLILQEQRQGKLFDQLGVQVEDEFDDGLVNESMTCFIMVRQSIPVLLPDSTIPIDHLEFSEPDKKHPEIRHHE